MWTLTVFKTIRVSQSLSYLHEHRPPIFFNISYRLILLLLTRHNLIGYSSNLRPQIRSFSSLFNLQSKSINFNFGHFSAKYQGYSLTFWPKIAHFHHFSICNQNQSISIVVIFRQNTKVIALLFGQKSLIVITFQSAIKINQFQFWSFFGKIPRL